MQGYTNRYNLINCEYKKNWIFSQFQFGFLLPVKPAKINFEIELEFSNLIFQNSSTNQQGVVFQSRIIPVYIALSLCTYDLEMHCIAGSGWLSLSAFQKLYYSKQYSFLLLYARATV